MKMIDAIEATAKAIKEWVEENYATTEQVQDMKPRTFAMYISGSSFTNMGTFTYEFGMTWEEFVASSYNTGGYFMYDGETIWCSGYERDRYDNYIYRVYGNATADVDESNRPMDEVCIYGSSYVRDCPIYFAYD